MVLSFHHNATCKNLAFVVYLYAYVSFGIFSKAYMRSVAHDCVASDLNIRASIISI